MWRSEILGKIRWHFTIEDAEKCIRSFLRKNPKETAYLISTCEMRSSKRGDHVPRPRNEIAAALARREEESHRETRAEFIKKWSRQYGRMDDTLKKIIASA